MLHYRSKWEETRFRVIFNPGACPIRSGIAYEMNRKYSETALTIISNLAVVLLFTYFFNQLPIENTSLAMDWKTEWAAMRGGRLEYLPIDGVRFPPWSLLPFLPLGLLSMRTGWGILAGISVCILAASVPRKKSTPMYVLSMLLAVVSFPSVRNIIDGNYEAIVVAGVLLILFGYSRESIWALVIGLLLATIKVQEVTLLLIILALYVVIAWPSRRWLKAGLLTAGAVGLSLLWRGGSWFVALFGANFEKYTNSIIDISLSAAADRLGFIPPAATWLLWAAILGLTLYTAWKTRPELPREKAGMLIAASLLLAPYAAGNSFLSVLAIGLIPLLQVNNLIGGVFVALINIPYLWSIDTLYMYQAYYWTTLLLLAWVVFTWRSLKEASEEPSAATAEPAEG